MSERSDAEVRRDVTIKPPPAEAKTIVMDPRVWQAHSLVSLIERFRTALDVLRSDEHAGENIADSLADCLDRLYTLHEKLPTLDSASQPRRNQSQPSPTDSDPRRRSQHPPQACNAGAP